jgi:hypothetical protein
MSISRATQLDTVPVLQKRKRHFQLFKFSFKSYYNTGSKAYFSLLFEILLSSSIELKQTTKIRDLHQISGKF